MKDKRRVVAVYLYLKNKKKFLQKVLDIIRILVYNLPVNKKETKNNGH